MKMQGDLTSFATFYKTKHQGHKLDWDHALGTATLRAQFSAGSKELSVSLYQAVILLLFNDETEIGFKQIAEHTRMGACAFFDRFFPGLLPSFSPGAL